MRRWVYVLLTVGIAAIVVVGLNQASDSKPKPQGGPPFDLQQALADLDGAPAPLAALHDQAAELLPDDVDAFRDRIDALKGFPIVINKWGSWCGPCRTEFPVFQRVGAELGGKVAFLGINGADPEDAASEFLEQFPVTYPSYRDGSGTRMADALDAGESYYPATIFLDREGEVVTVVQGDYANDDELRKDIREYLGV